MLKCFEMHANLMRATSLRLRFNKRYLFVFLHHLKIRNRFTLLPSRAALRRPFSEIRRASRNRKINRAVIFLETAVKKRMINLFYFSFSKLTLEGHKSRFGFRQKQNSRRVSIDTMHNSRSLDKTPVRKLNRLADRLRLWVASSEPFAYRRLFCPPVRMHDHSRRLIDCQNVVVLKNNKWCEIHVCGHGGSRTLNPFGTRF